MTKLTLGRFAAWFAPTRLQGSNATLSAICQLGLGIS